ncbi:MAG: pyridoxal-phosphate dependent enzyme [Chloroflexi bacterium]|nr:pyridoxal-phosphate dependent enzyme [Chloroflexota bacterium]
MWRCPTCGGVLELADAPKFDPALVDRRDRSVWRYRHTFPVPPQTEPVSLGEGETPLIPAEIEGRQVHFKLEYLNPSGSFKDRGTTVMVTALAASSVKEAAEDSSGNAGASFAAYAARAGIRARVFVPAATSGPKRAQIEAYGAELVPIPGPRSKAAEAVRQAAADGAVYASHNYNPIGLAGLATTAFELWETLGRDPLRNAWVIVPVGHGSNILGLARGFRILQNSGLIESLPRLVGVQALAVAPLCALKTYGLDGLGFVAEGETIAEGIRILQPVRGDAVLTAVAESGGDILAVDEEAIRLGQSALARLGFYVEPTSAVVWPALMEVLKKAGKEDTIAVLLTGSGFKSTKH